MHNQTRTTLVEQGELALSSLHYREQAALYHAAASDLQAALLTAKQGDSQPLALWLDHHRSLLASCDPNHWSDGPDKTIRPSLDGNSNDFAEQTRGMAHDERTTTERFDASLGNGIPISIDSGNQFPALETSPGHQETRGDFDGKRFDWSTMANAVSARTRKQLTRSEQPSEQPNHCEQPNENETALVLSLPGARNQSLKTPDSLLKWVVSPGVWVSLLLHLVALIALALLVFPGILKPPRVAITSIPQESETILEEAIFESTDSGAALQSTESPTPVDLSPPTMDSFALESGLGAESLESDTQINTLVSAIQSSKSFSRTGTPGAEFFGLTATGNTFVYIVDSSPSMRKDGAIDAAKREIVRSLTQMKATQRFLIMFFGKEVETLELSPGRPEAYPIYANPENVRKSLEWIERISIQKEGWPPNDALDIALRMEPDSIFLLFDGDTRADISKHLGQVNRSKDILSENEPRIPVHVIHFFQEEFAVAMKRVASENLGSYRFIPRPERVTKSKR
jgi:hypothetical protein